MVIAQDPMIRITVSLVQVDAVVTDSRGKRVTDLKADDFEIKQDGVVQKITHLVYVPDNRPPFILQPKSKNPSLTLPTPLAAGQVNRTVALVIDDLSMDFENIVRVRDSLRKYVEQYMQPGELVAIVRTGGGVAILEQFTSDKKLLLAGIELLKWKFTGRTGLLPINRVDSEPVKTADGPEFLDYGNNALAELGALGTIEQVLGGMRKLPGRKSIVYFSQTMRMEARITSALDHLTDLANRGAVSLYAIDPSGLKGVNFGNDASSSEPEHEVGGSFGGAVLTGLGGSQIRDHAGLDYLAKRTGGFFFANRNDIPAAIQQAVDDQMGYYLLGYSPQEGTFEKDPKKVKYHRIAVRSKRPGLVIRWKTGFNGVTGNDVPLETSSSAKTREQQLMEALASPFTSNDLKVRLTCFYIDFGPNGPGVRSMLHFQAHGLSFVQQPDKSWTTAVDVVTTAYRGLKDTIQQTQSRRDIRLPDDVYRRALKEGFLFSWDYKMKEPGPFLMRAVVRDAESSRIGSASQSVSVPDTKKGQLAMSGVIVSLSPTEVATTSTGKAEAWTDGSPAIRRYLPGQSVLYSYVVVNPRLTGSQKQTKLVQQMLVHRNGKLIYQGKPLPVNESGKLDARRMVGGGVLRLNANAQPGEYILQIVVTDQAARKSKSKVTQWIDFEVLNPPQKVAGLRR